MPRSTHPTHQLTALARVLLAVTIAAGVLLSVSAVLAANTGSSRAGAATTSSTVTYSATETIPAPPSSNFHGSSGGDGWAVALTPTLLRPVYPGADLGPAEEHLRLFLIQYWGGPRTYSEQRGHPKLRMRHAPFRIGEAERDAWLGHMRTALDELRLDPQLDAQIWDYLVTAAYSLVNSPHGGNGGTKTLPLAPS